LKYRIEYIQSAEDQLKELSAYERAAVVDQVDERLAHHPLTVSKNCRRMRENPVAEWRLRIGRLRVFFDISEEERLFSLRR
jgi:mRNA-degrading endonuclease RelE of RelBE toxin-antitoxin system